MKGIIFNTFEDFITKKYSDDVFEDIQDQVELVTKGPMIGPGTYPDEDFFALIKTSCSLLDIPREEMLKSFGHFMFLTLVKRFSIFAEGMKHPKEFLVTVEDIIHIEVKKLYPQADTPKFIYTDRGPNKLDIEYYSKRALCSLMEGMLIGTFEHFKTESKFIQSRCTHRGDDKCVFEITF